ncbi:17242_t:CDS:1, partial [Acaulospora colombiana]
LDRTGDGHFLSKNLGRSHLIGSSRQALQEISFNIGSQPSSSPS